MLLSQLLQVLFQSQLSNFHLANVDTLAHEDVTICSIITGDPPYIPEVSSATDTSNFDVDIESSKANVSNICKVLV